MKRRLRSQSGSAMIEFALFAPALILLFMGAVELGRWATYAILAENAARTGAGYGAQGLTYAANTAAIATAAQSDAEYLPQPYTTTVNFLCSVNGAMPPTACTFSTTGPPANTLYYVKVVISSSYAPWIAYPGIPNLVNINGSSHQQVYQQ
jgi:Flp pilus assembly protein TadG